MKRGHILTERKIDNSTVSVNLAHKAKKKHFKSYFLQSRTLKLVVTSICQPSHRLICTFTN